MQTETVTVTNFSKGEAIACSYYPRKKNGYENKVKNLFRISRDKIIEDRAERKIRREREKEFSEFVGKLQISAKQILKIVGVRTKEQYETVSIPRLERAAVKIREIAAKVAGKKAKEFID